MSFTTWLINAIFFSSTFDTIKTSGKNFQKNRWIFFNQKNATFVTKIMRLLLPKKCDTFVTKILRHAVLDHGDVNWKRKVVLHYLINQRIFFLINFWRHQDLQKNISPKSLILQKEEISHLFLENAARMLNYLKKRGFLGA